MDLARQPFCYISRCQCTNEKKHSRYSLIDLLKITLNGAPHFIRCFKPNRASKPVFDDEYMLAQLRYTGVLNIVTARQEGYTYRYARERYRFRTSLGKMWP